MLIKETVTAIKVSMTCENCKRGEMKFTGQSIPGRPIQLIHQCDKCHDSRRFNRVYPYIDYEG